MRNKTTGLAMCGLALAALLAAPSPAHAQASFVQNGEAGFVVSHIRFALSKHADETGACPDGMSMRPGEHLLTKAEYQQRDGETAQEYRQRIRPITQQFTTGPNGENMCANPEVFEPDPYFRTMDLTTIPAEGIDLDGADSQGDGQCPHHDFAGLDGRRGVDNQFYRVVGCSQSFQQPGGSSVEWELEMLTGAWGILIALRGVDDIKNDDEVQVGIYANADPIELSPSREPLEFATYAIDQDPRFRAEAKGRIVDGVLTTEPVDVRFHKITNNVYLERPLDDARLQMTIGEDGVMKGYLAGYTNAVELYDYLFGFRNGKDANGDPRDGIRSANGAAGVLKYTCHGAYHAIMANADADFDPETGKCTAISTQYIIEAIPAFVVDVETESANDDLARSQ